jgi:flagellar motor switch protein FliG
VVVSRLTSQRAAEVLAALPAATQVEVARRVVDLEETDPIVLREIEAGFEAWLSERLRADRRRVAGMTALAGILEAAPPATRENILANLSECDPAASGNEQQTARCAIRFSDFEQLDKSSLAVVLNRAPSDILVLALAGARHAFFVRAMAVVSAAKAEHIRRAHCNLGPTSLSDIEEAQHELARLAGRLEARGEINTRTTSHLSVEV